MWRQGNFFHFTWPSTFYGFLWNSGISSEKKNTFFQRVSHSPPLTQPDVILLAISISYEMLNFIQSYLHIACIPPENPQSKSTWNWWCLLRTGRKNKHQLTDDEETSLTRQCRGTRPRHRWVLASRKYSNSRGMKYRKSTCTIRVAAKTLAFQWVYREQPTQWRQRWTKKSQEKTLLAALNTPRQIQSIKCLIQAHTTLTTLWNRPTRRAHKCLNLSWRRRQTPCEVH